MKLVFFFGFLFQQKDVGTNPQLLAPNPNGCWQRQGTSEGTVDWHFNSLGGNKNYRPGETPQGAVSWILNLRQTSIPDPPPKKKIPYKALTRCCSKMKGSCPTLSRGSFCFGIMLPFISFLISFTFNFVKLSLVDMAAMEGFKLGSSTKMRFMFVQSTWENYYIINS